MPMPLYSAFRNSAISMACMPPQYSKANAANVLPVLLSDYMTTHGMKFTRQGLDDSLVLIEDENRFNPIADEAERQEN